MEIVNNTTTGATATRSAPNVAGTNTRDSAAAITSDFETFLVLLTAQMKNQDPLNPLDSQDFATQLATFSGVEQQVKTNDLLTALSRQMGLSSLADMASWVGMDARIAAPVRFSGSPVELFPNPPRFADRVELVVSDLDGREMQRLPITATDTPLTWAGVGTGGSPLASGTYEFAVLSFANGELIDTHVPEHYARVSEVRSIDGQAVVLLDGENSQPATNVTGLRAP